MFFYILISECSGQIVNFSASHAMPIDLKAFALCKKKFEAFKQNAGQNPVSYDFKIEGQQKRTKQITTLMDQLLETMPTKMQSVLRADHSEPNPRLIIISSKTHHPPVAPPKAKLPAPVPAPMQNLSEEARMAAEHAKTPAQHARDLHDAVAKSKRRKRPKKTNAPPEKLKEPSQSDLLLSFPEFREGV